MCSVQSVRFVIAFEGGGVRCDGCGLSGGSNFNIACTYK